jgi:ATP-dependent DNA helicase HFM1/MER3
MLHLQVLAENGVTSLALLRKQDPHRIESVGGLEQLTKKANPFLQLLNRRPPFGMEVLASVLDLPQYTLIVQEVEVKSGGGNPVEIRLRIECNLVEANHTAMKVKKSRNRKFDRTAVLTVTSDMDFIDFRRIP